MFHQSQPENSDLYSYNGLPINNTFTQGNMFGVYNSPAGCSYNQVRYQTNYTSYSMCQESQEPNWDLRSIFEPEKLKGCDKLDIIEITNKDLSPISYCSDLLPDVLKNNKEPTFYNKYDNQWFNNYNQKLYEYPSCAQVNKNCLQSNNQYCMIQKGTTFYESTDTYNNKNAQETTGINDLASCTYYDKNQDFSQFQELFFTPQTSLPFEQLNIDPNNDDTNEESDIIVEESEDDVTDYSEDHDHQTNKCVICNISYTPLGTQFYFLTSDTPLTMTTQKPVYDKIVSVVGKITTKTNYLCSECLGLINTIDHLGFKLENFEQEFVTKFNKTCQENNIELNIKETNVKKRIKYKKRKRMLCFYKYCVHHSKKHKMREKFLCELCGLSFKKYILFHYHKKKHLAKRTVRNKIYSYNCSQCKRQFRTKTNLKEHENYCLGTLPFKCSVQSCDKKFTSSSKLKNHVKLKHEKKFIAICSICNIGFVKLSDYKSHKISHSTDKKYSCSKCDKTYKTLSNLNFHMKVHNDKLPFICDICNKGFLRKEYLEAHINNHNGIKNFYCSQCPKKFASQKNLDAHSKYHDGSIKKSTCSICGKSMTTGFEDHMRIHNNLREFECPKCDMKFNTKGTLSKHIKIKHSCKENTS